MPKFFEEAACESRFLAKAKNTPLSNIDISNMLRKIPHFRGIFTRDILPKRMLKIECGIINSDTVSGIGKHWLAYFNDPKGKYVEFFNSFGLPPGKEILSYLESSGKDIIYNSSQIQSNDSVLCGYYSVYYIKERSKGRNMYDILYSFSQKPSEYNETKIMTGNGLTDSKSDILKQLYYNPKTGFSGINDLTRKARSRALGSNSGFKHSDIKKFLEQQDIYSRHMPLRKKFQTRRVVVKGIDDQWQSDLVEMIPYAKENNGHKYMLTCIDIFSKYSWAIPLKNKTSDEVVRAFELIFKERTPTKMQTDKGKEFYNSKVQELFKKHDIIHFSTKSNVKASIVERFNRTLKEKMWRYFSEVGTNKWIDVIDDLVYNYNNSYHTSIKMKPVEACKEENKNTVRENLYGDLYASLQLDRPQTNKFHLGDKVRISKWKSIYSKGYLQNYTTELFTISKVQNTTPITYKIKDWNEEEIDGIFYEPELVKYDKQDEDYEVEKILKTRTKNGKKELFVKWRSYGNEFNSWIPVENLKN